MPNRLSHALDALNQDYLRRFPVEAMREVSAMSTREVAELLRSLPSALRVSVWEDLSIDVAAETLDGFGSTLIKQLLGRADTVHAARVLSRLPAQRREDLLSLADAARAREIRDIMQYPDDTAGALMEVTFVVLHPDMTVREVLQRLRKYKPQAAHHLYFNTETPPGLRRVDIQSLALADPRTPLMEVSTATHAAVAPTAELDEVVEQFEKSKLADLPVIDINGKLMGIIHHEALVNAVREDTSADLLTMVGASKEERALSNIGFVVRKRLPWLQINLLTAFLAAAVVGLFENTIAKFTALAVLMPVVAGQSGNTGAQALAVTMRALALREISVSHWRRVARKEIIAALINGVAVSLTTAVGVLVWSSSPGLALVIGSSMILSMMAAGLAGVVVPITLSAVGQDPAQSSSIILTTITDVTGFFTFLGIATVLSGLL
jgi:magnesium transporter